MTPRLPLFTSSTTCALVGALCLFCSERPGSAAVAPDPHGGKPDFFAPINDQFTNAFRIGQSTAFRSGSNDGASREPGEPQHAGLSGGRSVWWVWTARNEGMVTIDTDGSSFDTLLAVYTGATMAGLQPVASAVGRANSITFGATAGTTYRIAVDGSNGAIGVIQLNLIGPVPPPPVNDQFANRIHILGYADVTAVNNESATEETGEPACGDNPSSKSVWWTWTASSDGPVRVATEGSSFDTLLAVYTGSAVNKLTLVAEDDDNGQDTSSLIVFYAKAGTEYQLAVDGFGGSIGEVQLCVRRLAPLRLLAPETLTTGTRRLWIRSGDSYPLDMLRMPKVQILTSPTATLPMAQWTPLLETFHSTNGLCYLDDVGCLGSDQRYYIARENP